MKRCFKTKTKVQTRQNLLRKLGGTRWRARSFFTTPKTGLTLCFCTRKYTYLVWNRFKYAKCPFENDYDDDV